MPRWIECIGFRCVTLFLLVIWLFKGFGLQIWWGEVWGLWIHCEAMDFMNELDWMFRMSLVEIILGRCAKLRGKLLQHLFEDVILWISRERTLLQHRFYRKFVLLTNLNFDDIMRFKTFGKYDFKNLFLWVSMSTCFLTIFRYNDHFIKITSNISEL